MAKQAFFGSLIVSPASCCWYRFLHRKTATLQPLPKTSLKVLLDQSLFAPISLALYFLYTSLTDQRLSALPDIIKTEYTETLLHNWMIWPIVQVVNFSIIPLNFQSPFVNTIAIFWIAHLSNVNSRIGEKNK